MRNYPIGVFDSGIGGLTVVKELIKELPNESIIYLGDTARVPYGTRGKKIITKFALELTKFLLKRKVKFLVVACNTISATCLGEIKKISPVPVLGVIKPAIEEAIKVTKRGRIGVIGTRATIDSQVYQKNLKNMKVLIQACPLFVPLVEEGVIEEPASRLIAKDYLKKLVGKVDTLILGCTHYPILRKVIQQVMGSDVTLIDSANPTALKLKKILTKEKLLNDRKKAKYQFYITDAPDRINIVAKTLFEGKLPVRLKVASI